MKKPSWFQKLKLQQFFRKDLDVIFNQVPEPTAPIRVRMNWLEDLVQWIRTQGPMAHQMDFQSGTPQALRVKYLLQVLARNPQWHEKAGKTLASILSEAWMTSLFATTGLIARDSFWSEVWTRIERKILPNPPFGRDLKYFTEVIFTSEADSAWVRRIDENSLREIYLWINRYGDKKLWSHIQQEERQAILILSGHLRSMGFHPKVWSRINSRLVKDNPFLLLDHIVTQALSYEIVGDEHYSKVVDAVGRCRNFLRSISGELDDFGVDLGTVFLLDRMELSLKRFIKLWILMNQERGVKQSTQFMADLIQQSYERRSLRGLFSDSFALISRDITERQAETGETYITRNWKGFQKMLKKALGGGAVMAITTLIKFGITSLSLAGLITGLFASINYVVSFVGIHLMGWTLATKQPANTGPALASKMQNIEDEDEFEKLIEEIIHLTRTQMIGIFGNVIAVVPLTALICFSYMKLTDYPLISTPKALKTISSFSIIGLTPLYAAFTGVLLWLSAVLAGWIDNWFAFHRLYRALRYNRRLIFAFGEQKTAVIALWLKKNIGPITGNASLGFFLGGIPALFVFAGIPLDVRHVTLAAGSLGAALSSLNPTSLPWLALFLAILGIIVAGFLNVGVSFVLALAVALKARRIDPPDRARIFKALRYRFRKEPLSFFFPARESKTPLKSQSPDDSVSL